MNARLRLRKLLIRENNIILFRNGRKFSLGNSSQSTLCRKSHIVKFFDSSSEDESLSVEAKTAIRRRRRTRESVDRLGMMIPLEGDTADFKRYSSIGQNYSSIDLD